ncbi:hypothetical protein Ppa06_65690 [Planomonospora parontospora subsp. parontospora]|uniref:Uncharacterized protein n=2 Tax=Planomonospora parontospora TaxID=58119 RepID=A0AA37BNR9_9ACTN|nr:hypothetical protein GCM10010126_64950 [Planomonospora parontospora]GII12771.1 hypothetical protein Ppa06_65690 [Planomonospora parontospora subsp. parontospora]
MRFPVRRVRQSAGGRVPWRRPFPPTALRRRRNAAAFSARAGGGRGGSGEIAAAGWEKGEHRPFPDGSEGFSRAATVLHLKRTLCATSGRLTGGSRPDDGRNGLKTRAPPSGRGMTCTLTKDLLFP